MHPDYELARTYQHGPPGPETPNSKSEVESTLGLAARPGAGGHHGVSGVYGLHGVGQPVTVQWCSSGPTADLWGLVWVYS